MFSTRECKHSLAEWNLPGVEGDAFSMCYNEHVGFGATKTSV
jgi:hypothetical protein